MISHLIPSLSLSQIPYRVHWEHGLKLHITEGSRHITNVLGVCVLLISYQLCFGWKKVLRGEGIDSKDMDESQNIPMELTCTGTEHRAWTCTGTYAGLRIPHFLASFTLCCVVSLCLVL